MEQTDCNEVFWCWQAFAETPDIQAVIHANDDIGVPHLTNKLLWHLTPFHCLVYFDIMSTIMVVYPQSVQLVVGSAVLLVALAMSLYHFRLRVFGAFVVAFLTGWRSKLCAFMKCGHWHASVGYQDMKERIAVVTCM